MRLALIGLRAEGLLLVKFLEKKKKSRIVQFLKWAEMFPLWLIPLLNRLRRQALVPETDEGNYC